MFIERIARHGYWTEAVVVRLVRRWVAGREYGEGPAGLVALAGELGLPSPAAIALDSLLQLTESCLGRQLQAECCCSRFCSPDERAVLMLIATAQQAGPGFGSAVVPHGLPAALSWAAASFNHLLDAELPPPASPPERCPFDHL